MPTTVRTFLFTDIEGSYRQWERHPEAMPRALATHDAIVQEAVTDSGGRIFKTVGDAVCAVFERPAAGVRAAVQAQRALHATPWEEIGLARPLTVRMAVQSGEADERDGDFSGLVLNRISRMLRAGHGGQVLVSPSVAADLEGNPLGGVGLRDLGERRLRDVPGANHIYQLEIEGLPSSFPPLETLDTIAHNLPVALNACLDRETEQAQIRQLLLDSPARLVTLLGPGGIGKTRLALHAAMQVIDAFAGGIWFVDFSGARDASSISAAVVAVLGGRIEAGSDPVHAIAEQIGERSMLLILDNCEQIVGDVAAFVAALLPRATGVRVLATSRVPLQIRGEQRVEVGPLPVETGQLAGPAVQLFLERAQQIRPSFEMSEANRAAIFEICHRVDGIPLALELAAARVAVLSPEALRNRLTSRLTMLTSTSRDLPERHQTLRAAIAWSYALLTDDEQVAFRQLSVFQGGWSFAGAQAVLGIDELATMEVLTSLRDKSLVRLAEMEDGEARYSMLETIQEFAFEQLFESGEAEHVQLEQARYFVALSEEAAFFLEGGPQQGYWLKIVDREIANIRAAIQWSIDLVAASLAVGLCVNLWFYWSARGLADEGQRWFEQALALAAEVDPATRAEALQRFGNLCVERGELCAAEAFHQAAYEISRAIQDQSGIASSLIVLGMVAGLQGRSQEEYDLQIVALEHARDSGSRRYVASSLLNLAIWARNSGQAHEAIRYLRQVIELQVELRDDVGIAFSNTFVAIAWDDQNELDIANVLLQETESVFASASIEEGLCLCWLTRASIELKQQNLARAGVLIQDVVDGCTERKDMVMLANALEMRARIGIAEGELSTAAESLGSAQSIRERTHSRPAAIDAEALASARSQIEAGLGARAFEMYWEHGRQTQLRLSWTTVAPPDLLALIDSSGTV